VVFQHIASVESDCNVRFAGEARGEVAHHQVVQADDEAQLVLLGWIGMEDGYSLLYACCYLSAKQPNIGAMP
jgi:hypothetical protein